MEHLFPAATLFSYCSLSGAMIVIGMVSLTMLSFRTVSDALMRTLFVVNDDAAGKY